jgi:hypothetical protein
MAARFIVAFIFFIGLATLASLLFFGACISLFEPFAGASGNLARQNPPSLSIRVGMAVPSFIGSLLAFFLAAYVAKWGLGGTRKA